MTDKNNNSEFARMVWENPQYVVCRDNVCCTRVGPTKVICLIENLEPNLKEEEQRTTSTTTNKPLDLTKIYPNRE